MKYAFKARVAILLTLALCSALTFGIHSAAALSLSQGDCVYFGRWDYTDAAGAPQGTMRPILWTMYGDTTFVSVYLLDQEAWGEAGQTAWSGSSLRDWLTGDFLNGAFAPQEAAALITNADGDDIEVTLSGNGGGNEGSAALYGGAGYFGAAVSADYWTRSPGNDGAFYVDESGLLDVGSINSERGIRPIVAISPNALLFRSTADNTNQRPGSPANPYRLYLESLVASLAPLRADATPSRVTLRFDRPLSHAYENTPSDTALAGKFRVVQGTVTLTPETAVVSGDIVVLALPAAASLTAGQPAKVGYLDLDVADDTDGIGFVSGDLPTVLRSFGDTSADVTVVPFAPALTGLAISPGTLSPAFSPYTASYTVSVASSVTSIGVTPTTTSGITVTVNGTSLAAASTNIALQYGSNAISIALNEAATGSTASYSVTVTRAAPTTGLPGTPGTPSTPGTTPQPGATLVDLDSLLAQVNEQTTNIYTSIATGLQLTSNRLDAVYRQLSQISGAGALQPIQQMPASAVSAQSVSSPQSVLAGLAAVLPSTEISFDLTNVSGNILSLQHTINPSSLPGLGNFASMSPTALANILTQQQYTLAFEQTRMNEFQQMESAMTAMIGNTMNALTSWSDAFNSQLAQLMPNGIAINLALVNTTGNPLTAGGMFVIPAANGVNGMTDPVWLMQAVTLTATPTALTLVEGASADVVVSIEPATATTGAELFWRTDNTRVASLSPVTADGRTCRVTGLSTGETTLTAILSGDESVRTDLRVTVTAPETEVEHSSGGGCTGAGLWFLPLLLPLVRRRS